MNGEEEKHSPQACDQASIPGSSCIHHFHFQGSVHMGSLAFLGIGAPPEVGSPTSLELVAPLEAAPPPLSIFRYSCQKGQYGGA